MMNNNLKIKALWEKAIVFAIKYFYNQHFYKREENKDMKYGKIICLG